MTTSHTDIPKNYLACEKAASKLDFRYTYKRTHFDTKRSI